MKVLKSEKDYNEALSRLKSIFNAVPGTPEGDEFELLTLLIDKYDEEHYPIPNPNPLEAIKYAMEEFNLTKKDLGNIIGNPSRVSEIFSKKRKITLQQVRTLHEKLHIPAEVLIQDY